MSVAATVNTELTTTEGQELSLILLVIQSLVQGISNDSFDNTVHSKQKQLISLILGLIQGYSENIAKKNFQNKDSVYQLRLCSVSILFSNLAH